MTIHNYLTEADEKYDILAEFPFDSTRKRMTLIVRYQEKYLLMCKGADSIMIPRCNFKSEKKQLQLSKLNQDLLSFAKEGLRTLVVAQKEIKEEEYKKLSEDIFAIKTSSSANKDDKLNDLYAKHETKLEYVGSTAIEDKLQYGVPETIAALIRANIRVWVLTGDKQETAIEIGKSCELIQ